MNDHRIPGSPQRVLDRPQAEAMVEAAMQIVPQFDSVAHGTDFPFRYQLGGGATAQLRHVVALTAEEIHVGFVGGVCGDPAVGAVEALARDLRAAITRIHRLALMGQGVAA